MTDLPHRLRYFADKFSAGYPVEVDGFCELMREAAAALEAAPTVWKTRCKVTPTQTISRSCIWKGEALIYDDARFSDVHPVASLMGLDFQHIGQRVHIVVTALEDDES